MKPVILNGPTGVGKSTLAARLHEQISTSILIHIDELRRTIPNYREKRKESLELAYQMAASAMEQHFRNGNDVIIDKTIADAEVLDRFIDIARKYNVEVYEFLLFAEKDVLQKRADDRGYIPGGLLTPEKVKGHWESANRLSLERANAIVIDTTSLSPEEAFNIVSDKAHLFTQK
jgi:predicted kinase